jgi:hypothetical protein
MTDRMMRTHDSRIAPRDGQCAGIIAIADAGTAMRYTGEWMMIDRIDRACERRGAPQ